MTPRKGRIRHHAKRSFDLAKWPVVLASLLAISGQLITQRGQLIEQEHQQQTSAQAVAAMMKDVGRLAEKQKHHDVRITRLERAPQPKPSTQRAAVAVEPAGRSPGLVDVVANAAAFPFRLGAALWNKLHGRS